MDFTREKGIARFLIIFSLAFIFAGVTLLSQTIIKSKQTRPLAAPFVGCIAGVAGDEWLCQCELPNGEWFVECSTIEAQSQKQPYIDSCGGDKEKAYLQWKYDIPIIEAGGKCTCGGQNVCPLPETQQPKTKENPIPYEINPPTDSPPTPTTRVFNPNQPTISFLKPQRVFPTEIPQQESQQPQSNAQEFIIPQLQFPNFNLNIDVRPVGQAVNASLGFFENIFYKIKSYDASLENYINNLIHR